MIKEWVQVIVVRSSDNKRISQWYLVETDGSYDAVQVEVNRIVNRNFLAGDVLTSHWQY